MEIQKTESETCEFKESIADINSILDTICAFLNKRGGTLFLGISDNGVILGLDIGVNTIENLSKSIRDTITPKKSPLLEVIGFEEKNVIKIEVPEGDEKPYFCKGKAFIRLGKSNMTMSAEEVEAEFKKRLKLESSFEEALTKIEIKEYDKETIKYFYRNARESIKSIKVNNLFLNLGVELEGKFNIAGAICFSKNPQRFLPQFSFRCGILKKGELVSIDLAGGNIFEIIEKTFDYIKEKIGNRFEIVGTIRKTIYDYPLEAIREAIVNSLVHRDINFSSSNYLAIYEDHLEIRNPGGLPSGLNIKQLKEEHPSIQRNKKLANVLYLANYIENWGTGTTNMVKLCREAGLTDPEFIQEGGFFKVRFWKKPPFSNSRQEKSIELIKRIGKINSNSYAKRFKITDRTARLDLKHLEDEGFLKRERIGRKIFYKIR